MKLRENRTMMLIKSRPFIWILFFILSILSPWSAASPLLKPQNTIAAPPADPYHMAVREYLDQNDEAAIAHLKEALRLNKGNKRARQLLLKVFLRSSYNQYKQKNYKKVRSLVKEAKKYFPSDPKVKALYASIQKSSVISPGKARVVQPNFSASKSRKAAKSPRSGATHPVSPPASTKAAQQPSVYPQGPATLTDRKKKDFSLIVVVAGFLVLMAFLAYAQLKNRKVLLEEMKILQDAFQKQEAEASARLKKLEVQKESRDRAEELCRIRKEEEHEIRAGLERRKREGEKKLLADLMEKRRKEEERMRSELEAKKMEEERKMLLELQLKVPPSSKGSEAVLAEGPRGVGRGSASSPTKRGIKARHTFIQYQEKQITELLVDVSSPQREMAWERIATQAMSLYETSPKEAVRFFQNLVKDKNPFTRASIISALARIGDLATLDILLELRHDSHPEVKKEVLKYLKNLQQNGSSTIPDHYRQKINNFLQGEKVKADWVF